jgi:hypothetical protein
VSYLEPWAPGGGSTNFCFNVILSPAQEGASEPWNEPSSRKYCDRHTHIKWTLTHVHVRLSFCRANICKHHPRQGLQI